MKEKRRKREHRTSLYPKTQQEMQRPRDVVRSSITAHRSAFHDGRAQGSTKRGQQRSGERICQRIPGYMFSKEPMMAEPPAENEEEYEMNRHADER